MAASTGTIGIDLGSNNIVIAVAKRGGVEILANEGSHRETQNVVGFSGNERFVGEQAVLKVPFFTLPGGFRAFWDISRIFSYRFPHF